jgi:DNA-binding CsgD family transcriptional regulator
VSEPLSDEDLFALKRQEVERAAQDPRILALLDTVVRSHPRQKIHWLSEDPEEVLGGWLAKRLVHGRLTAMIDKAESVRALRALAGDDLQQYANDERRGDLDSRLFKRLRELLPAAPKRFTVLLASEKPGNTYWTLTERPATAIFSGTDAELVSHVFACALNRLHEDPMAKNQTQFLTAPELERYAHTMLERTARALSPDQLIRGLVLAYDLKPTLTELPDESWLGEDPDEGDDHQEYGRESIPSAPGLELASDSEYADAHELLATLSPRQIEVLKDLHADYKQSEIASRLGCSPATISNERDAIAAALMKWPLREEQLQVLRQTIDLLDGSQP